MGVRAKIEQSAPNRPPTMGEGDVDASLLWDWFVKSENFLRHKNTANQDMAKTVAYGMTSVHAIRWLAANGPALPSMSWDTYKEQMRALFLPTDWEYTARMNVLRLKQGSRPFMDFALDAMGRNNLLADTPSFMNDDFLRDAIEAGMDPELAQECHRENTNRLTDFRPWLDEVKRLDERRRQRFDEIAKEFARLNVCTTVPGRVPPKMAAFNARNSASNATSASASSQTSFVPIPKLLDSERTLLQEHGGCYKCRKFYAGHIGPRCPNPPIDGATYKTLTAADVPSRPASYAARGSASSARPVAAVVGAPAEEELISFNESKLETIAAVLPHAVSAVVDTGSPDYSDDECAPFSCSNLFWSCFLSPSPHSSASSLTVKGLIDDGSSVVLIKEDLVKRLQLPISQADDPFLCQAAFSSSKTSLSLSSYVKIQPVSLDGRFTSRPLRAFVSPSLVTDLILGLPFLNSNALLVDHGNDSCTVRLDNQSSYDLLHPSALLDTKPVPLWKSTHIRASEIRAARRRARPAVRDVLMGAEMASRLRPRLNAHPARGQRGSRSDNIIAALKERIEDLNSIEVFEAQLKRLDGEMKRKYADLFPEDIPPVHQLPDTTYHRFVLKDAHRIIRKREYACPRKWQDAWRTLLEGHLAAGRMRPSDSEFSASARPVAFESKQLSPAEKNYPTHDKEMLAIVRALHKWRNDLLGAEFEVFTDHRTLEFFNQQRDLSKKQLRWQEFLADFNFTIKYVRGEDNTVADALSRQFSPDESVVAPVLTVSTDSDLLRSIKEGYASDPWCSKLLTDGIKIAGVSRRSGLLYVADRLVVPRVATVRESIFRLAHDSLGHFGATKSYEALRDSFYWPNMRRDLEQAYIPGCVDCQKNKAPTTKPAGPLHSLPVPDDRFRDIALDFVGPLPEDEGFNYLLTITDRLGADIRLIPCLKDVTAERVAALFFQHWYCENGLPATITSDRDKLFVSRFWSALHELTGVKLRLSSAFHPETDGASERTNKTVIQCLRFFVDRHQRGWVNALPNVRFSIMNTVNASTGFSPFMLRFGLSPRVVPPLIEKPASDVPTSAIDVVTRVNDITAEAKDNLLAAKISQTIQANAHRRADQNFAVGDSVFLSTSNRRKEYMHSGDNRVAKFMPRFDGPYEVIRANPEKSSYTLNMPNADNVFPTFHSSLLRPFFPNDGNLFPSRELERPAAIIGDSGDDEFFVEAIIDEKHGRRGMEYLVSFRGYGAEENRWLPRSEVEDLEALDRWLAVRPTGIGIQTRGQRAKTKKISAPVVLSFLENLPPNVQFTWDSSLPFLS